MVRDPASFRADAASFAAAANAFSSVLASASCRSSSAGSGNISAIRSASDFRSRDSFREATRAVSIGRIPSSRSTIFFRSPFVTSENASSCFCSANTDALKTW